MAARSQDALPAVRRTLADLPFPAAHRDLKVFAEQNPEALETRQILAHLPESTDESLERVPEEAAAFQRRIRERADFGWSPAARPGVPAFVLR